MGRRSAAQIRRDQEMVERVIIASAYEPLGEVTSVAGKTGDVTLETTDVESGTFADARISESSVTQHTTGIDHDALSNYNGNEHVDHTAVTLTAGNGLSGGGDISSSRSFAVVAGAGITVSSTGVATNDAQIDHDALANYAANEHIDWTSSTAALQTSGDVTLTGALSASGAITFTLPSTDPGVLNQLWLSSGVIAVSTGT